MSEDKPKVPRGPGNPADHVNQRRLASPRAAGILALLWLLVAIGWFVLTISSFLQGDRDYVRLVFGLLYLAVGADYIVRWRRAKRQATDRTTPAS